VTHELYVALFLGDLQIRESDKPLCGTLEILKVSFRLGNLKI
jgi:hypothetical protein